tara:strand:- start:4931 stop:5251 length:321 start_codon:yes stop_codon:yes gene_type:complete
MTLDPVVENTLLIIVGIFVGIIIGVILLYSYFKSYDLFITTFCLIIIVYTSLSMSYILEKQKLFNERDFYVNMISDIFVGGLAMLFLIFFGVKSLFSSKPVQTYSY